MSQQEYNRQYYLKNKERLIAKSLQYQKDNPIKVLEKNRKWKQRNRDKTLLYAKRAYRNRKVAHAQWMKEHRAKNPEMYRAKWTVENHIRAGKLERPSRCSQCETESNRIEGHHPDYSRPLEIIWVCKPCHAKFHFRKEWPWK